MSNGENVQEQEELKKMNLKHSNLSQKLQAAEEAKSISDTIASELKDDNDFLECNLCNLENLTSKIKEAALLESEKNAQEQEEPTGTP